MEKNKQVVYSIQDAFKSLGMLEDDEALIDIEPNLKRKVLSEKIENSDDSFSNNTEVEKDLEDTNIDTEIEKFTEKLRELKEKYDKNPKSLTEGELNQLKESSIIEKDKDETASVTESTIVNVKDKKQVQQEIDKINKVDDEEVIEIVVDVEAEGVEELKDSYVGNLIIQCPVCKTLVYKTEEEIIHSEEDEELVNVEEECPHCKSTDGFAIIGKVAPIEDAEKEPIEEPKEESEEDSEEESKEESEESEEEDESEDDKNENLRLEKPHFVIEDLNEELFNRLATKYLNNIYENVDNFKTDSGEIEEDTDKVIIEGTINFKSGKKIASKFVFEARTLTKKGRVRFVGINESLSSSKKTFVLVGRIVDSILMPESLTYNYSIKVNEELKRIYGRVTEDLSRLSK